MLSEVLLDTEGWSAGDWSESTLKDDCKNRMCLNVLIRMSHTCPCTSIQNNVSQSLLFEQDTLMFSNRINYKVTSV